MGVVDARVEREQALAAGIAEVAQAEEVLDACKQRVVVVFAGDVDRCALDVTREQQQADPPTAEL
jgi:hypothetical protein